MIRLDHRQPVPEDLRGAIVALGNFDGFHLGHQAVVGEAVEWAWELGRPAIVAVSHRIGRLTVGEAAVAIAVATPHRAESFEICREVIEDIKRSLPVWKRQVEADGSTAWKGLGG